MKRLLAHAILVAGVLLGCAGVGLIPKEAQARVTCGGYDEKNNMLPPCQAQPAKSLGKPTSLNCPSGSFLDVKDALGGLFNGYNNTAECWACPTGYNRNITHVESQDACIIGAHREFGRASFKNKTGCPDGQYEGAGSCWACPAGYWRSVWPVDQDWACGKDGRPWAKAVKKGPAGACAAGSFYDPRGGGECWACPGPEWVRNISPVDSDSACWRGVEVKVSPAKMVKKVGCPVDSFFDPIDGGTCWACPSGYQRAWNHVKSENACYNPDIGWETPAFPEPGLFGIPGATQRMILMLDDPDAITKILTEEAKQKKSRNIAAYVADHWGEIQANPTRSQALNSLVLMSLLDAVKKAGSDRDAAAFVQGFASYVQARRAFVAQDALNMYDAWKRADTAKASQGTRGAGMAQLFDYGTVPPNFQNQAMKSVQTLAATTGLAGSVTAVAAITSAQGAAISALAGAQSAAIHTSLLTGNAVVSAGSGQATSNAISAITKAAGASGALAVAGAFIMIGQIAISNIVEISQARPRLERALAEAQAPVNLVQMTRNGEFMPPELVFYWTLATGGDLLVDQGRMPAALGSTPDGSRNALLIKARSAYEQVKAADFQGVADLKCTTIGVTVKCGNAATQLAASSAPAKPVALPSVPMIGPAWKQIPGNAFDISVNGNEAVWVIGVNDLVYRLTKGGWQQVPGQGVRVAATPDGNAWLVNRANQIFQFDGQRWLDMPGNATDVAVGADGSVYVVGLDTRVYQRKTNQWQYAGTTAERIAVDREGQPWIIGKDGLVARRVNGQWTKLNKSAMDIAGGPDGNVYIIDKANKIYASSGVLWMELPGSAVSIGGSTDSKPWITNAERLIFKMN